MISKDYISFFKELEKNNHKEWFDANRKRYESNVRKPFLEIVDGLIPHLKQFEPKISSNPKDALFRINRDIRFSKDKTPYNTIMKAGFSAGGKRSELPGFYLGIDAHRIHIGGGLFNVKPPELKKIRNHIAMNTDEFIAIVENSKFKKMLGEVKGEKAKRLDKEHQEVLSKTPLIANKQFFAMGNIEIEPYLDKDLSKSLLPYFETVSQLNRFLSEAW